MQILRLIFIIFLSGIFFFSLSPCEGMEDHTKEIEDSNLPRSITIRTEIKRNEILSNSATAQLIDEGYTCSPTFIYSRRYKYFKFIPARGPLSLPCSSIDFLYKGNGFFEKDGKEIVIYGKKAGKGTIVFPKNKVIYRKPYCATNNVPIVEIQNTLQSGVVNILIPLFGISRKDDWNQVYFPYGGFIEDEADIKTAEQFYFSIHSSHSSTEVRVRSHTQLLKINVNCLNGRNIRMENLPHSGPSAFDIPREHGISAGAALCEGYAKFEFIQPTPEGVVRQVYKSFQCSHPGGSFKLVDILFVQDLEHTYLQKFEDFPPQIDPNDLYLKEDLLAKIQANLQITKLEEALAEENIKEKGQAVQALSPFWEDIQYSLIVAARFIDRHPYLAEITIQGLQLALGGPLKFAFMKVADYLVGDKVEKCKEIAQRFLAEKLNVPQEQVELTGAVISLRVDLRLITPAHVIQSAKKVLSTAKTLAQRKQIKKQIRKAKEFEDLSRLTLPPSSSKPLETEGSLRSLDLARTPQPSSKSAPLDSQGRWPQKEGKEWRDTIIGRGQETGGIDGGVQQTYGHRFRSYREAITEAKKGDTDQVYMNRGYKKATGESVTPNRRPDVIVVKKDKTVHAIEVQSKTDKPEVLFQRNQESMKRLPPEREGKVRIIEPTKAKELNQ